MCGVLCDSISVWCCAIVLCLLVVFLCAWVCVVLNCVVCFVCKLSCGVVCFVVVCLMWLCGLFVLWCVMAYGVCVRVRLCVFLCAVCAVCVCCV